MGGGKRFDRPTPSLYPPFVDSGGGGPKNGRMMISRPFCRKLTLAVAGLALGFQLPQTKLSGQSLIHELEIAPVDRERFSVPVTVDIQLPMGGMRRQRDRWMARVFCAEGNDRPAQVVVTEGDDGRWTGALHWVEPRIPAGEAVRLEAFLQPGPRRTISGAPRFQFTEGEGYRDMRHGDRGVMRFVTIWDPENHEDTHKPYQHLFSVDGSSLLTKGPGGRFPHHKGVFLGWNRTMVDGNRWDFWHARAEYQVHREFLEEDEVTGPEVARATAVTEWVTPEGKAVVRDTRRVTAWRVSERENIFDYDILIESLAGEIELGGDAHHAGFQIRAAGEVTERSGETIYLMPETAEAKGNDLHANLNWKALSMPRGERTHLLVHMDHPENPRPTVYSGRDYGRFGAFFVTRLDEDKPLRLRYRIVVQDEGEEGLEMNPGIWASRQADFAEGVKVSVRSRMPY